MKRVVGTSLLLAILVAGAAMAAEATTGEEATAVTMTGKWILNERMSDSFDKLMPQDSGTRGGGRADMGRGGGGGMGRGGGRGGGGGQGRGGGRGNVGGGGGEDVQQRAAKMEERREQLKKQYTQMEIFLDGAEVNVTDGLDISRLMYTDGRETSFWTDRGELKGDANWNDETLMVTWKNPKGDVVRMCNYRIDEQSGQLTVSEEMRRPGSDEVTHLRLVYDRRK